LNAKPSKLKEIEESVYATSTQSSAFNPISGLDAGIQPLVDSPQIDLYRFDPDYHHQCWLILAHYEEFRH
jgi:hypothetical protein